MSHLRGRTRLEDLRLRGAVVTGARLAHIEELGSLTELDLQRTAITAAAAERLQAVRPGLRLGTGQPQAPVRGRRGR